MSDRWDDEPVGDYESGTGLRRRWRRAWNQYLAFLVALIGAFVLIGALPRGAVAATAGGLCLLAAAYAVVRADGPKPTMRRPQRIVPPLRTELTWYAVALVLALVGAVLVAL
jgi:hypothetical protein